ncbi:MAG: type II toxin-antitoxin system PemK/MazF family toxin [Planctomycetes bacterium]|nr:type II toxin-antitoxin system PemK/MazF family toxin [Planctomycetota bacterium]
MRRGEIWWANLPRPAGRRPVVLLSRDEAYAVRELVIVAPITTCIRHLAVEVPVGPPEGLPKRGAVNVDVLTTIPKRALSVRVSALPAPKLRALDAALRFALGLGD